jgi:surface protein
MFAHATSFNQELTNWDVSTVTDMDCMFEGANSFNKELNAFPITNIISGA